MISYIKKLLYKLLAQKKQETIKDKNFTDYICEVNFKLRPDQNIDIEFLYDNVQDRSVDEISILAETCANLIVLINNGLIKKDLLNTIKNYKKQNMNNEKNTLFLDNVLFFNNLLQEELKAIKKDNGPLIRPLMALRSLD
jgi:dynactin complex subunit